MKKPKWGEQKNLSLVETEREYHKLIEGDLRAKLLKEKNRRVEAERAFRAEETAIETKARARIRVKYIEEKERNEELQVKLLREVEQRQRIETELRTKLSETERVLFQAPSTSKIIGRRARLKHKLQEKKLYEFWYEVTAAEQGWVCAICGKPPPRGRVLVIDHDHRTGEARGLLCNACNSGIGFLREDPIIFQAALEYLAKYRKG